MTRNNVSRHTKKIIFPPQIMESQIAFLSWDVVTKLHDVKRI
jgi:hypothetical protein